MINLFNFARVNGMLSHFPAEIQLQIRIGIGIDVASGGAGYFHDCGRDN